MLEPGAVLIAMAARGITRLLIEGGSTVSAAFVEAGLVDEFVVFRAAETLGNDALDAVSGHDLWQLLGHGDIGKVCERAVGSDTMSVYRARSFEDLLCSPA